MSLLLKFALKTLFRENLCDAKYFDILFKNFKNINFDHFTAE